MKKFLITTVFLFVLLANAQKSSISFSKEQQAKAMAIFTENVKPVYQKGQTYKEFEKALLGNWSNTKEGTALLNKAFQFISNGVSKEQIQQQYTGSEIANALLISDKAKMKSASSDGCEVFGGSIKSANSFSDKTTTSSCKWYQICCLIEASV